jgi:hypothetical protein
LVSNAVSGPIEDASAAIDRGDTATAFRICRPLAEQGNAEAQNQLGVLYSNAKDYGQALKWFRQAAERHLGVAETNLGGMYLRGEGVARDIDEGVRLYKRAALDGYLSAGWDLGSGYYLGQFGKRDYVEAAKWYRFAADRGYAPAAYELARLYQNGEGVPRDVVSAHMWSNLAAAWMGPEAYIGKEQAVSLRRSLERSMTPEQIAEAQRLARDWKPTR